MSLIKVSLLLNLLLSCISLYCQPILVVTQEKAGTTHINASLGNYFGGGWDTGRNMIRTNTDGSFGGLTLQTENYLRVSEKFKTKNIHIVDHYHITDDFLSCIINSGNKITFIHRDPRSAIVSKAIHQVLNNNSHDWKDQHLAEEKKSRNINKIRSHIDKLLKSGELDNRIAELKQWMKWKKEHPNSVNICSFDLLKKNRSLFFNNLLKFYGIRTNQNKYFPGPGVGLCRYRNSPANEWMDILTEQQVQFIQKEMDQDLCLFYEWKIYN